MKEKPSHELLAERITQILIKLNNSEKLYLSDLSDEFKVSTRTIRRDLGRFDTLLERDGKAWVMSPCYLGKLSLKDLKQFSLFVGLQEMFPSLDDSFLRALLNTLSNSAYLIKSHSYANLKHNPTLLKNLEKAIKKQFIIQFWLNEKERLDIRPYKLVNNKGIWYLAATEEGKLKAYDLGKISFLRVTEQYFEHQPKIFQAIQDEDSIWYGQDKTQVTLHVAKDVAYYFKRRKLLPNQEISQEMDDGGLIVSSKVTHLNEILPLIKYWLPHINVVAPKKLKQHLFDDLKQYMET